MMNVPNEPFLLFKEGVYFRFVFLVVRNIVKRDQVCLTVLDRHASALHLEPQRSAVFVPAAYQLRAMLLVVRSVQARMLAVGFNDRHDRTFEKL